MGFDQAICVLSVQDVYYSAFQALFSNFEIWLNRLNPKGELQF